MARASRNLKKSASVATGGAVGTVAGSIVGAAYRRHGPGVVKGISAAGTGLGMVAGSRAYNWGSRRNAIAAGSQVPSVEESKGTKTFKVRVGTKTNGRVGKADNPYM